MDGGCEEIGPGKSSSDHELKYFFQNGGVDRCSSPVCLENSIFCPEDVYLFQPVAKGDFDLVDMKSLVAHYFIQLIPEQEDPGKDGIGADNIIMEGRFGNTVEDLKMYFVHGI